MNERGVTDSPRRWVVLGAACVVQLALGAVYVWSIFGAALGPGSASDLRLSASQAMEPFEAALGMIVFGAALGGWLQDRMGPRVVALSGGCLYSAGVLIASLARAPGDYPLLLGGYGLLGGLGLGVVYVVPTPMLQKWFPEKRAFATGIAVAGFGFGGVLTTCVAAPVIARHASDPAEAFLPLGLIYLVMLLIGGSLFRDPPAEQTSAVGAEIGAAGLTLRAALRTPHWYLLTLVLFANVTVSVGFIGSAAGGARALGGFSAGQAAALVSVIAVFNGAGRVLWAWASERIGRLSVFAVMFAVQACCCAAVALAPTSATFGLAAVLVGLCCGGGFGTMPATAGDYFGLRHAGTIYGCMLVAWSAGGILGPRWVGALIDLPTATSYRLAYAWLGGASAAAIALALGTALLHAPKATVRPEWMLRVNGRPTLAPSAGTRAPEALSAGRQLGGEHVVYALGDETGRRPFLAVAFEEPFEPGRRDRLGHQKPRLGDDNDAGTAVGGVVDLAPDVIEHEQRAGGA